MVGERVDISSSGGTKLATGYVEQVEPFYTVLRSDTGVPGWQPGCAFAQTAPQTLPSCCCAGLPVTIPNKVRTFKTTLRNPGSPVAGSDQKRRR